MYRFNYDLVLRCDKSLKWETANNEKIYIHIFSFLWIIGKKSDISYISRTTISFECSILTNESSPSTLFFISPNRHPERVYIYIYMNTRFSKATHGHVSLLSPGIERVHTRATAIGIIFRYGVTFKATSLQSDRAARGRGRCRSGDSIRQSGNLNC